MPCHQRAGEANIDTEAVSDIATAVTELLAQLQDIHDPIARASLSAEFSAEIDGLQERLRQRYHLDNEHAGAVIARSLAHVSAVVRAATQ